VSEIPAIWKEERLIESFEVDMFARLRPHTLLGLFLNGAWNAARGSVYGYEELSRRNLMWVLVKVQIEISRMPGWREKVILETWGKRVERLYALRDFAVATPAGERMACATTLWMVLDKNSGRPQRLDSKTDGFPWMPGREGLATSLEKVPLLEGGRETARYRVKFSDIDVNRHVNSARYLQWLVDSESRTVQEEKQPGSIEISYLAEAVVDEEVAVFTDVDGKSPRLASIRRTSDGKELCRGRVGWRDRDA